MTDISMLYLTVIMSTNKGLLYMVNKINWRSPQRR